MATCKDCLHYEVCQFHIDEETKLTVNECEHFKDRSKIVELPCKVGEDLYRLKTINGKTIITTTQLNQNTLWRIVFGGEYGKTVFLTRKEAERALKDENRIVE